MGKPSAPEPLDPVAVGSAQTGTNVNTAIAQMIMNMVNQTTPQGALTYNQTGDYNWTDPVSGESYSVPQYSMTSELNPAHQQLYDTGVQTQQSLANLGLSQSNFLGDYMSEPFSPTTSPYLQSYFNRGASLPPRKA